MAISANTEVEVPDLNRALREQGFAIVEGVLAANAVDELCAAVDKVLPGESLSRQESVYGVRDLFNRLPLVRDLAGSPAVRALVEPVLGREACAVRGLFFDKTPCANWRVPWHQDLTIAVRRRIDLPGFGPWSRKAGVAHVQPPHDLLARMVSVRLHLDDCGPDNGPLQVIPGSHRLGRLDAPAIEAAWRRGPAVDCTAHRGGAVLMRPLIVHGSAPAEAPGHRRVIHLEFAAEALPGGLEWHECIRL